MKKSVLNQFIRTLITDRDVQKVQLVQLGNCTLLNLNVGESDTDVSLTIFHSFEDVTSTIKDIRKEYVNNDRV